MSIEVIKQVWGVQLTRPERDVLLAMADHADKSGHSVYPGLKTIAWKTDYSEQQVRRIIRQLIADKILVEEAVRPGKVTIYSIDLKAAKPKEPMKEKSPKANVSTDTGSNPLHSDVSTDTVDEPTGVDPLHCGATPDTQMSPEPSLEPLSTLEPSSTLSEDKSSDAAPLSDSHENEVGPVISDLSEEKFGDWPAREEIDSGPTLQLGPKITPSEKPADVPAAVAQDPNPVALPPSPFAALLPIIGILQQIPTVKIFGWKQEEYTFTGEFGAHQAGANSRAAKRNLVTTYVPLYVRGHEKLMDMEQIFKADGTRKELPKQRQSKPKGEPTPKPTTPYHDKLLSVFGLAPETVNAAADKPYWHVAAILADDKDGKKPFPLERIPELYAYVKNKAQNWTSWTVYNLAKYAADFLRDCPTPKQRIEIVPLWTNYDPPLEPQEEVEGELKISREEMVRMRDLTFSRGNITFNGERIKPRE